MYANSDDGNGNEASKDGSTFRGRGFIQLTHRGSYGRFTAFYQKKYNDYNTSFINTPDLVADDLRIAVLSSLWEFCVDKAKKPFNNLKKADLDNIVGVSRAINGGDNAMDKRKAGYAKAKKALCL
jgi:putative chitinase/type VI secretion system secreted protein VgrG